MAVRQITNKRKTIKSKQIASIKGNSEPGKARISARAPWPLIEVICLLALFFAAIFVMPTSALTYQDTLDTSFTFNSSIGISLSSADLVIDDLLPNAYADSNIITITAMSNSPYGYQVTATAGNGTNYTNTNLIDTENNNNTDSFSSLSTTTSYDIASDSFTAGKWGYSYCYAANDCTNTTNWINANGTGYSGLPYYSSTGASILSTNSTGTSNIQFKIGAKANTNHTAGTYNNVINFIITAVPEPKTIANSTYLQEVEACPSVLPIGQVYTLKDSRDEQEYKVAKLKDDKCWMVENLNLAGGTAVSAADTDVSSDYITNGSFPEANRLIKSGNTLILPASATTGFNTNNYSFVYNSGNKTNNCSSPGCYSYYSWDAATLGSGRDITTENTDATYSVCPKGWRLPTSGSKTDNGWKRGDFYKLATAYGADLESASSATTPIFYNDAGPTTIVPNFLFAGYYYYSSPRFGNTYGYCLSSTSTSGNNNAAFLHFSESAVYSANFSGRALGLPVRCLLAD